MKKKKPLKKRSRRTSKAPPAKSTSAELKQQIAFLNSIIENIPHMIFLKDSKNLRFVRMNKAGEKLLGYPIKELLGKNDYDLFPKEEADFFTQKDREVIKKRGLMDIAEEPIQTKKKGLRTLHTKKVALNDLKGKSAYLLGISEDITEKKESAARLLESEKQLHLALSVAGVGVWSWQVPDDVLFWDENMFRIFGVPPTPNGIINYSVFSECLHPQNRERVNKAVKSALEKTPEYTDTFTILHPEKGERKIAVRCAIDRDSNGNPIRMTGTNLDITEQQQKHTLEVKSEMISMVSHELRTPLHTIKESISVILDGLTGDITGEQKDILDTAKQCIDRLTRLINNVLDYQKMEAGIVDLGFEKHNLNELVQHIVEIEKPVAEKKKITLESDLCNDELIAEIDSDKIIQVLTNLIHNAVKFTDHGSVTVKTESADDHIKISVHDTGIGFSSAEADKIFHEFGQTEASRKRFPQGTGLGLAISRKIIHSHNGKIWAESNKPLGSSFHVTLPHRQKT